MNTQQARFNMVEQQIRPWQVLDPQVLTVLSNVPRELFVPQAYQALAYADTEIPLGHGETMVPPRVDARLMHDLQLTGTEKVLEIGTGSGYLAALLAGRAQRVVSLEINPELASNARNNLQRAGITNVDVRVADGSTGASGDAPFDAIVLGGSVAEVPQALLQQLKVGGHLLAIVGQEPMMVATLYTRTADAAWSSKALWDHTAPRLQGFTEPTRFKF
ncbi:protein-L-isoaspartate O-methyltransferase [Limnohabitans sp. Rim8]|jgi:protein-L-isoaspartate(D-aspartate) O-methyltransferase|uniref:Protein-L-isoaspartate O-methyltransferase n=1 Tax=Limnohabitans curvus TaxID=323423 RepID=A0A315EVR1_9BURK|nr:MULTISPECIES: protein-L-isoaspartate O-methyltransferase [Limnohabitans]PUE57704.1 protein-L-isoaspartate O-methyltransferase [Limnohabitans sp. Rim8]PUE60034.1 protein-L-isoaspartate O-methyltransferase [Limnohabitans curvus]